MEIISKKTLQLTSILGLVMGAIASIPIPTLIIYIMFFMFCLTAPALIIYLKAKGEYYCSDFKESAFFGAGVGIISTITFMITFIPLCLLFGLIPNNEYMIALRALISPQALWLDIIIIFMLSIISAGVNSVSAMGAQYLVNINVKKTFEDIMSERKNNGNRFKN